MHLLSIITCPDPAQARVPITHRLPPIVGGRSTDSRTARAPQRAHTAASLQTVQDDIAHSSKRKQKWLPALETSSHVARALRAAGAAPS
jgi:hypothetical protein